jgi:type VI secretion system secreted protein VgrG
VPWRRLTATPACDVLPGMPIDHVAVHLESSHFPCEGIQIHRLRGKEAISQLFSFDLEIVVAEPAELDPDAVDGAEVDIVFTRAGEELRRVHGMITTVDDLLDSEPKYRSYRLRVMPRAYRLALVQTQELFIDMAVPAIVQQKLSLCELGGADVEMRLTGTYAPRELTVEYKETDLAFISRLTEHLGISFFFEQHEGRDKLVFTDHANGFRPVVGAASAPFRSQGDQRDVYKLESRRSVMPHTWMLQDYNYRMPTVDLTVTRDVPGAFAGGVVEYGPHHKTPAEGNALVKVRSEERVAECRYFSGESDVPQLTAGASFALEHHPRLHGDKPLLVVEIEHEIVQVVEAFGGQGAKRYQNRFRAVDAGTTYRPPRVTPRPRMHGVITGLIEPRLDGTVGKVADIDAQGRYTVRFYFDTTPLGERPKSSHRVRMIQQHSGPNYGTHLPLKAGIEVLVVFVDGDPDRPLIVGSVHNPVTPNPVTDTDPHKHQVKTASGILVEMRDAFQRS